MSAARTWLAAAAVAVAAFLLYDATLLPGQDLGDTASFQATIGTSYPTPRQAYPLYYATGNLFAASNPRDPARAINMASAVFGALACGLLAVVVAEMSGLTLAGVVGGLLLAVSYTFWSQAIIAEVYALHAFMTSLSLVLLLAWARRPTLVRLAIFFAVYAVGFGDHLSMILLLPGFALFVLLVAPGGPASMIRPRVAGVALAMAILGASLYAWNLAIWLYDPQHPGLSELLSDFYFDVTKADWRATMVMGIPEGALRDRIAMYAFDLRQQFGVPGLLFAGVGVAWCALPGVLTFGERRVSRWRIAVPLAVLFLFCWFFAFTYNVGDAHVFYLPAHYMVAVFAGLGAGGVMSLAGRLRPAERTGTARSGWSARAVSIAAAVLLLAYPAWRGYDTYPALDRSHDWQVKEFFDRLTRGLTKDNAVLAADLNWQIHNGLDYYAKYTRPDLAAFDTTQALMYLPWIVKSNRDDHRSMVVTNGAAPMIRGAYGNLYDIRPDDTLPSPALANRLCGLPPGTPYVLTFLQPYPDLPVDTTDLGRALTCVAGRGTPFDISRPYNVMAGRIGARPGLVRSAAEPFRISFDPALVLGQAGPGRFDVRIECWLPADTIRRMGFGRVVAGRRPALTLDRGLSFVAFKRDGSPGRVEYAWTILAPQPRWIIPWK